MNARQLKIQELNAQIETHNREMLRLKQEVLEEQFNLDVDVFEDKINKVVLAEQELAQSDKATIKSWNVRGCVRPRFVGASHRNHITRLEILTDSQKHICVDLEHRMNAANEKRHNTKWDLVEIVTNKRKM